MGTDERGAAAVAKLHFPGLSPEAARWLVANRSIQAIGLDTPSIDYGQSTLYESHRALFERNIPAFENLADLSELPLKGFNLIALPMKIGRRQWRAITRGGHYWVALINADLDYETSV